MLFSETPSAATLKLLIEEAEQKDLDLSIINRLKVILFFIDHHQSITHTCRYFGISRSTFHRWIERFDPSNLHSLQDRSHDSFSLRQSAVSPETVELIRRYRMRFVQMGKEKISELLSLDHGITLSPSTVGRVIERKCLYFADTPFHWKKRIVLSEQHKADSATHERQSSEDFLDGDSLSDPLFSESLGMRGDMDVADVAPLPVFPRIHRFGFWRFLLITSVVSNIVFASAMIGIALFERSTAQVTVASDSEQIKTTEILHTAPTTVPFP